MKKRLLRLPLMNMIICKKCGDNVKKLLWIAVALTFILECGFVLPVFSSEQVEFSFPETVDFISFEGYQVRETEYNGLRSIFKAELSKMPDLSRDGYEVVEYGTVMASSSLLEKNADELVVEKGEKGTYVTLSYGKIIPIFRDGRTVGKTISADKSVLKYACTVINFSVDNFDKDVSIRGYAVLASSNGEERVVYADYPIIEYRSVSLESVCDAMLGSGEITKDNISYSHVVKYREQLKEEEGWSPIWKPR